MTQTTNTGDPDYLQSKQVSTGEFLRHLSFTEKLMFLNESTINGYRGEYSVLLHRTSLFEQVQGILQVFKKSDPDYQQVVCVFRVQSKHNGFLHKRLQVQILWFLQFSSSLNSADTVKTLEKMWIFTMSWILRLKSKMERLVGQIWSSGLVYLTKWAKLFNVKLNQKIFWTDMYKINWVNPENTQWA